MAILLHRAVAANVGSKLTLMDAIEHDEEILVVVSCGFRPECGGEADEEIGVRAACGVRETDAGGVFLDADGHLRRRSRIVTNSALARSRKDGMASRRVCNSQ